MNPKLKNNILLLFILSLICLIPSFISAYTLFGLGLNSALIGILFVASVLVFILPFSFLKAKMAFLLNGFYILFAAPEIYNLIIFKAPFSESTALYIFQTDIHEAKELLLASFPYLILAIFTLIAYFYVIIRFVKNEYVFNKKQRIGIVSTILFLFILFFLFCFNAGYKAKKSDPKENELWKGIKNCINFKLTRVYPINVWIGLNDGYKLYTDLHHFDEKINLFHFDAKQETTFDEKEIYVLIIGESARAKNFSLYGYERKTSPNLDTIQNVIHFKDVFAQANATFFSLPTLLTRSSAKENTVYKEEKTVVDAFQEAGFSTYWIGNQSFNHPLVGSVTKRVNHSYFWLNKDENQLGNFDENLFPYFDKAMNNSNEKKQFIVIHTLGSHFRYNYRYPSNFSRFTPDLNGSGDYAQVIKLKNKEALINSYDNTILYADFFVSEIIRKVKQKNAVSYVFYISDHGENLYDDAENQFGHGTNHPTNHELYVPMIVWTSDKYQQQFPHKTEAMLFNQDKKLSTKVVFHSLLDLGNVYTDKRNDKKSIANETLISDSIRYARTANNDVFEYK